MLEKKLTELKKKLVWEASLAEDMVKKSVQGLVERNKEVLEKVINEYEPKMNELEIEMDEFCINLIALHQPEAGNLRTILMVLKMNNDLERIGDLAVNISESALFLIERPPVKPLIDIPRMAEETINMLKDAVDSFINEDVNMAKSVCERDEIVDNLRDQIFRELITYMSSDPSTIERSIHLIRISRSLERIADLATNISEDVIFMVKGKVIKHRKDEN
ncbi:MAG: phosphate signaling complex protein PhoU [Candidatus Atribacteria bacterium]|nr:phosphate signaling complex protein PhoU [Candidatus Atribacteria bacterium]MCD6350337.1 phosphate signaling complex protein PhoU [Candidatus Atribacteria bacterium]